MENEDAAYAIDHTKLSPEGPVAQRAAELARELFTARSSGSQEVFSAALGRVVSELAASGGPVMDGNRFVAHRLDIEMVAALLLAQVFLTYEAACGLAHLDAGDDADEATYDRAFSEVVNRLVRVAFREGWTFG